MRKILIMLLVLAFIPVVAFAAFLDMPEGHWAYNVVTSLTEDGVIDGYEDGSFRPEGLVTRGEGAKILCEIASLPEGNAVYEDVSEEDWFYTYSRDCGAYIENGTVFSGNTPLTREEVACAVAGIKELSSEDTSLAEKFSDYKAFKNPEAIAAAVEDGFISGYEDGSFRPEGNITRAEFCSMVYRAFPKPEEDNQPSEKKWSLTKIASAELENFRLNAIIGKDNKLLFIEPEEESEIVFEIDLPEGMRQRETAFKLSEFTLKDGGKDSGKFYYGLSPISLVMENDINRVSMFGEFTLYDDGERQYDVSLFRAINLTNGGTDYASFEEGKAQYSDEEDCIPQLLHIHNEAYTVVFDGKSSVYRFERTTGIRQGKLYTGNENTYRGFLSVGDRMYGIDQKWNLSEYDLEELKWNEKICTLDADVLGIRYEKFWLWDKDKGCIYTSDEKGKLTELHSDVSIEAEDGIDLSKLDSHMLVYDENTFILYDGESFLMLKKN